MIYVVDASVVVKWFVAEEGTDAALCLREAQIAGKDDLSAPNILLYEVSNVLLRKRHFTREETLDAAQAILQSGVDIVAPDDELISDAIRLADVARLSMYDAAYAALAAVSVRW